MSAYVAARTYVRFSCTRAETHVRARERTHAHTRTRGHACTTCGPPAKQGASARVYIYIYICIYVCTTSTGTVAGYYRSPGITNIPRRTLSRTRAYPWLYARLSSLLASLFSFQPFSSRSSVVHGSKQLEDRLSCHSHFVTRYILFLRLFVFSFFFSSFFSSLIIVLSTKINGRLKRFVCTDIDYLYARFFTIVKADVYIISLLLFQIYRKFLPLQNHHPRYLE